ncbi:hypothetical protein AVEN_69590-1 [Araneus ventricosus]|uniref:Mos1 transposase HTH domain-containing protein n=1 Tax=Araneus ventricosus TaxID=182803 RepID=A0A4Y2F1T9_ARAVE|nr:hypothetical protein AVEN_69590-1 [Araneus ventricosus]
MGVGIPSCTCVFNGFASISSFLDIVSAVRCMMDSSRSAQRAVIQFLRSEGEHASQIYHRVKEAHVVTNNATISAVDKLIRQNRWIITREIAVELSMSKGNARASHYPPKVWLWQSLCTVGAQVSVRESEDGEMGTGSVSNPGVSTLNPSTPFLRSGDQCMNANDDDL